VTISSDNNSINKTSDNSSDVALSAVSFGMSSSSSSSSSLSLDCDSNSEKSQRHGSSEGAANVKFENLVVRMGLLKCGHRYRLVIPMPNQQQQRSSSSSPATENSNGSNNMTITARIIEDSLDGDLTGEIEKEEHKKPENNNNSNNGDRNSSPSRTCQLHSYFLKITLSASRRGPYRGRFALELISCCYDDYPPEQQQRQMGADDDNIDDDSAPFATKTTKEAIENEKPLPSIQKCIMSVQVDATIMGKDMGTPKLRNGVVCLGKMVGYDSDDDSEWQGFE